MTRYGLSSDDIVILRDGRPFGESGVFGGTALDWPMPQTLAGMCRSSLGFGRSKDFFANKRNLEKILAIGLKRILPYVSGGDGREFLLPTPADLVFVAKSEDGNETEGHKVHPLRYAGLSPGEGTDLNSELWLYPLLNMKGKPTPSPRFLRWDLAGKYLADSIPSEGGDTDMDRDAVTGPVKEFRVHTAIDPCSRSVDEGRLYAESGIYLKAAGKTGPAPETGDPLAEYRFKRQDDIVVSFELEGTEPDEKLDASLYLGGERKRVDAFVADSMPFPQLPNYLENQRFLKLLLITHGDFGSWAPPWLLPGGDVSNIQWTREPLSGIEVRLRSAVVKGWDPVSGWDYAKRTRKAFRKLARPGSVYVVELKNPAESEALAKALWGNSLCPAGSQSERDGFGQTLIAKTR